MGEQAGQSRRVKRICAGILAHVDSGKTTLAEAMLYRAGALRRLGLTLQEGEQLFVGAKVAKTIRTSVNTSIPTLCYRKDTVTDRYNELILKFRGNYSVIFRMYDDGMAYRFGLDREGETIIEQETAAYRFPKDYKTYTAYVNNADKKLENQFYASFENTYTTKTLTELDPNRLKMLPLLIDLEKEDYPEKLATLGLTPVAAELREVNNRYRELSERRRDKKAANEKELSAAIRLRMDDLYKDMTTIAFVRSIANPTEGTAAFISQLNAQIDETTNAYKTRVGIAEAEKKKKYFERYGYGDTLVGGSDECRAVIDVDYVMQN